MELTILMRCLNEALTVETCMQEFPQLTCTAERHDA